MDDVVVHLDTDCPAGKAIPIAKRDSVRTDDFTAMDGLWLYKWCEGKSA